MLPTQKLLFNSQDIAVYGTESEPMFKCLDIIKLLGYKKSGDLDFYRKHMNNPQLITTIAKQGSKDEKYFTKAGIYECLLTNDATLAKQFRSEVVEHIHKLTQVEEQKQELQSVEPLEQHQQMLSISNYIFEGSNIHIQGTNEDPLFNCLDVIKILGCREANQNWFYQKNRLNADYIVALSITDGTITTSRPINQHSGVTHYFTETGLYECLFASDQPIAKQFRREIIQLLKNIRLGVVGIHIIDQEEFKRQLQEKGQLIEELQSTIKQATKTCYLYKERVKNEQGDVIYEYAGSTTQKPEARDRQHRRNSCNKGLRKAFEDGKQVDFEVQESFEYLLDDHRKQREKSLIQSIPSTMRLNISLTREDGQRHRSTSRSSLNTQTQLQRVVAPNISQVTNNETPRVQTEEIKDDLSAISECTDLTETMRVEQQDRIQFKSRVDAVAKFIKDNNGQYPRETPGRGADEYSLAQFIRKVRTEYKYNNGTYLMNQERYNYINQKIPGFVYIIDHDAQFTASIQQLKQFIQTHNRYPKCNADGEEYLIASFLMTIRSCYKQKKYSQARISEIEGTIPGFIWDQRSADQIQNVKDIQQFYITHNRLPLQKENKQLQQFAQSVRSDKVVLRDDTIQYIKNNQTPNFMHIIQ